MCRWILLCANCTFWSQAKRVCRQSNEGCFISTFFTDQGKMRKSSAWHEHPHVKTDILDKIFLLSWFSFLSKFCQIIAAKWTNRIETCPAGFCSSLPACTFHGDMLLTSSPFCNDIEVGCDFLCQWLAAQTLQANLSGAKHQFFPLSSKHSALWPSSGRLENIFNIPEQHYHVSALC